MDTLIVTAPAESPTSNPPAWVGPIPKSHDPLRMELRDAQLHRDGVVIWRGTGVCQWGCGCVMEAEAGQVGYCPNVTCAGPLLAVLPPRGDR